MSSREGSEDFESDWESVVFSTPADFFRSLPQGHFDDKKREWIAADEAIEAGKKKNRVQSWLAALL